MPGRRTPLGGRPLGAANIGARGYCGPAPTVYPRLFESAVARQAAARRQLFGRGREPQRARRQLGRAFRAHGIQIVVKSAGIAKEGGTEEYQYFEAQPDQAGQDYVDQTFQMEGGGSFEGQLEKADEVPATAVDDEKPKYRPVFLSANAITLSNGVQLVLRFIGEPEVIHKFYDFIHCTCYWSSWDGELVLPAAALEAIITKELRYVGSLYPLCSIIRIRKFVARGWHINAGQILKICVQLNALDLLNIEVLKDQLTGVDAFYFMQVIGRLKEKQLEEGGDPKPVDATYLMTIIDRMF